MDERIARIILEHHERCDGLGYPSGKFEDRLDPLGQIVAMADSIQAIRVSKFAQTGRTLRDLDPFLNMNADVHSRRVYTSACGLLRKSGLTRGIPLYCSQSQWLAQLDQRWQKLAKIISFLETLSAVVVTIDIGMPHERLKRVFNRLLAITHQSGLLSPELGQWIEGLQQGITPDSSVQIELGDVEIMLDELGWQLRNAKRAVQLLLDEHPQPTSPTLLTLKTMTDELSEVLNSMR